jgi:transposase-like protein
MPNDLGVEGTNGVDAELEAAVAAAAFARGGGQPQRIPKRAGLEPEDNVNDEDEEDEEEEEDDDDDDEDDLPPPPPRKKGRKGDNKDKPKKISRRQQPPKTNITRTRYSNDFKMRVVSELEEPGYGSLSDIARHYQVAEQTLRDWMKNKDRIADAVARRGNMKANPVDHLKHVTDALLKYMDEQYAANPDQPITARMIAQKGNEIRNAILAEDSERPYLTDGERKMTTRFSASLSWGKKWVRQYARP